MFLYAIFLLCSILFGQMWGVQVKGQPNSDTMLSIYISTTRPPSWSQKKKWKKSDGIDVFLLLIPLQLSGIC